MSSLDDIEEERELKQMVRTIYILAAFYVLYNYSSCYVLFRRTGLQCQMQSMPALGHGLRC